MKTETCRMLRIVFFEALVLTAAIYAAIALTTRHYSKPYWVSQIAVVIVLAALPKDAYRNGKIS